jgi:hypothetical protein
MPLWVQEFWLHRLVSVAEGGNCEVHSAFYLAKAVGLLACLALSVI